jgi:hypothetical protein
VLVAALGAVALVDRPPALIAVVVGPVAPAGVAGAVLLSQPEAGRSAHQTAVIAGYLGWMVLSALAAAVAVVVVRRGRPSGAAVSWWAVELLSLAVTVGLGAADAPGAAYRLAGYQSADTNLSLYRQTEQLRQAYAALRRQIGPDTPVLYLAYGQTDYLMGNPTHCRYPSPVWLQRSTYLPYVRDFASYRDNAACLVDPGARYLAIEPHWIRVSALAPELRAELDATFDCAHSLEVADGTLLLCPVRPHR